MDEDQSGRPEPEVTWPGWCRWLLLVGLVAPVPIALLVWCIMGDWSTAGQFGDTFNVVTATASTLAFVALVASLWMQRKELSYQRRELFLQRQELRLTREEYKLSRGELEKQAVQLEQQASSLKDQWLNDVFYRAIGSYEAAASGVVVSTQNDLGLHLLNSRHDVRRISALRSSEVTVAGNEPDLNVVRSTLTGKPALNLLGLYWQGSMLDTIGDDEPYVPRPEIGGQTFRDQHRSLAKQFSKYETVPRRFIRIILTARQYPERRRYFFVGSYMDTLLPGELIFNVLSVLMHGSKFEIRTLDEMGILKHVRCHVFEKHSLGVVLQYHAFEGMEENPEVPRTTPHWLTFSDPGRL